MKYSDLGAELATCISCGNDNKILMFNICPECREYQYVMFDSKEKFSKMNNLSHDVKDRTIKELQEKLDKAIEALELIKAYGKNNLPEGRQDIIEVTLKLLRK